MSPTSTLANVEDINPQKRLALIQVLGAITYGELKAYNGAMEQSKLVESEQDKKIYRKIAAEELRHHKGFSRRLEALGADIERAMAPYKDSLDSYHSSKVTDPIAGAVAGYLGEGIASDMLNWLKKVSDVETSQFIDTVIEDETEHEQIAIEKLKDLIASTPLGWLKAQIGVQQMLFRMIRASNPSSVKGPRSFGAFLKLGRSNDLVYALTTGMSKRVLSLDLGPRPLKLPKFAGKLPGLAFASPR